jgi:endonuclease/exonuclease/phosphatase family metal-dependent hydrolase
VCRILRKISSNKATSKQEASDHSDSKRKPPEITVMSFNLGGTKYSTKVQTFCKENRFPEADLIFVCEGGSVKTVTTIFQKLSKTHKCYYWRRTDGDVYALFVRRGVFLTSKLEAVSHKGRYFAKALFHLETGKTILVTGVHFPYKQGKQRCYDLFRQFISEEARYFDAVLILGDFNIEAGKIGEWTKATLSGFPFEVCLKECHGETTPDGGKKDNILILGLTRKGSPEVLRDITCSDHYPVHVRLCWPSHESSRPRSSFMK